MHDFKELLFLPIKNEKSIIELDINLLNIFEKYPKECRDFLDMIVKDQKTRKLEYRNMYIYEAKNYKEERKNNLVLIVDWLKKSITITIFIRF